MSRTICDAQLKILDLLGHETPVEELGEKVISQFVSEFDEKTAENQYRILTSMPRDISREDLQKLFGIRGHKARKAKDIQ